MKVRQDPPAANGISGTKGGERPRNHSEISGSYGYTHGEDTRSIASMAFSFDKKAVKNAEKLEAEKHEFLLYSEEELEELLDEKEKKDNEET